MRPWLSSLAATRSIVAVGMTRTRRRGPNTAMPNARPATSSASPPSARRRSGMASSSWHRFPHRACSARARLRATPHRVPPWVRRPGPTTAATAPAASSTPLRAAAAADPFRSMRSKAMSVVGSRRRPWLRRARLKAPLRRRLRRQRLIGCDDEARTPDKTRRPRSMGMN